MEDHSTHTDRNNNNSSVMLSRKILPRTVTRMGASPVRGKKKSTSLPPETVEYLKNWILSPEHINHPYPTEQEKADIMRDTGIELKQLTNWFVNNRKRFWKPRVEARLREQQKTDDTTTTTTTTSAKTVKAVVSTGNLTELPTTTTTTRPTDFGSPARHLISAQSSVASETNSIISDTEGSSDNDTTGQTTEEQQQQRTEIIPIHILTPLSGGDSMPSLEDVTVLHNIPTERILHTYEVCIISYRCDDDDDAKKTQSRRDAEIVRVKKQYLRKYCRDHHHRKRPRPTTTIIEHDEGECCFPRPKFRRASVDLWKEACQMGGCYDKELPSLEEATTLFGFATN